MIFINDTKGGLYCHIFSKTLINSTLFKLPHNCTHCTCQQDNAQNPPSQASAVCELRTSRCKIWIQKRPRGTGDQIPSISWIIEKAREFQKKETINKQTKKPIYFIDYAKAFACRITTNCGKFLKRWEYQTTLPVSCETCMWVKKQQLELDM